MTMAWLTQTFLGKIIATMLVSMVPVIELRGGIPYGIALGLTYPEAFIAAFIGNILSLKNYIPTRYKKIEG